MNHPNKLFTTILVIIISGLSFSGCLHQKQPEETASNTEKTTMKDENILPGQGEKPVPKATITIVYDNNPYDPRLRKGWGFSCLIKTNGKTILFDTGGDGSILLGNMEKLGIDPKKIDIIVLSHIHGDHTGGLETILALNKKTTVYTPKSFPEDIKNYIRSRAKLVEVGKPAEIVRGVYTTGELGTSIVEQSLVVVTPSGLVVVTGCAHPGIIKIVEKAKELVDAKIHLVVGGFHLGGTGEEEIKRIATSLHMLGVERVMPCHCTGSLATKIFAESYGKGFVGCGVGKTVEVG